MVKALKNRSSALDKKKKKLSMKKFKLMLLQLSFDLYFCIFACRLFSTIIKHN